MSYIYLSREDWDADKSLGRRGHKADPLRRTELIFHHTAAPLKTRPRLRTLEEAKETMGWLQVVRRADLGADVPYNFVVIPASQLNPSFPQVYICEGRGWDYTGAHTKGHNTSGIAFSFHGNYQLEPTFDLAPVVAAVRKFLFDNLDKAPKLLSKIPEKLLDRPFWVHSDFKATDCPGTHLFRELQRQADGFVPPLFIESRLETAQPATVAGKRLDNSEVWAGLYLLEQQLNDVTKRLDALEQWASPGIQEEEQ